MSSATGKQFHRRTDSSELDVFEAARYFSGYNDNFALIGGQKMVVKDHERQGYLRAGRVSLDMPSSKHHHHQFTHSITQQPQQQQQQNKDNKKHKQPSSPGGKLAHFLNSLFSQTTSKKKKSSSSTSKSTCSQTMRDELDHDQSPNGRRKRRSSISHFRLSSTTTTTSNNTSSSNGVDYSDSKSLYSSSSFGFRTPPPYVNTPTKSYKDFRSFADHKQVLATLSKYTINGGNNGNGSSKPNIAKDEKIIINNKGSNVNWVDEKFKFKNGVVEKSKNFGNGYQEKVMKFKEEVDDGFESDSSSDLFELQLDYEFGFCSSGLPVYETTHMDSIKRSSGTPITNGPIKN